MEVKEIDLRSYQPAKFKAANLKPLNDFISDP